MPVKGPLDSRDNDAAWWWWWSLLLLVFLWFYTTTWNLLHVSSYKVAIRSLRLSGILRKTATNVSWPLELNFRPSENEAWAVSFVHFMYRSRLFSGGDSLSSSDWRGNAPNLYSKGTSLESLPGHWLSWGKIVAGSPSSSRRTPEWFWISLQSSVA